MGNLLECMSRQHIFQKSMFTHHVIDCSFSEHLLVQLQAGSILIYTNSFWNGTNSCTKFHTQHKKRGWPRAIWIYAVILPAIPPQPHILHHLWGCNRFHVGCWADGRIQNGYEDIFKMLPDNVLLVFHAHNGYAQQRVREQRGDDVHPKQMYPPLYVETAPPAYKAMEIGSCSSKPWWSHMNSSWYQSNKVKPYTEELQYPTPPVPETRRGQTPPECSSTT